MKTFLIITAIMITVSPIFSFAASSTVEAKLEFRIPVFVNVDLISEDGESAETDGFDRKLEKTNIDDILEVTSNCKWNVIVTADTNDLQEFGIFDDNTNESVEVQQYAVSKQSNNEMDITYTFTVE